MLVNCADFAARVLSIEVERFGSSIGKRAPTGVEQRRLELERRQWLAAEQSHVSIERLRVENAGELEFYPANAHAIPLVELKLLGGPLAEVVFVALAALQPGELLRPDHLGKMRDF